MVITIMLQYIPRTDAPNIVTTSHEAQTEKVKKTQRMHTRVLDLRLPGVINMAAQFPVIK